MLFICSELNDSIFNIMIYYIKNMIDIDIPQGYMKHMMMILIIVVINVILPLIMNALNVDMSYVLNYYIILNAMIVFYYILPSKVGKMFEE